MFGRSSLWRWRRGEVFPSVIIITVTLLIITLVALIRTFVYKCREKKTEAVKRNSKNKGPIDSSRVPLDFKYDNLSY